jgi:hypothetical protein
MAAIPQGFVSSQDANKESSKRALIVGEAVLAAPSNCWLHRRSGRFNKHLMIEMLYPVCND